ncbi:thiol:disulfide interchange protein [Pseudomonas fluorescens]|uniref:cytochrome c biogenesis protein CcdA n=1 Tax=Pseudomonas fluorescens TaxID=294 RepID=UPI0019308FA9|nr:protein-disulfide reductase DsbD domain-containing protein [Pseudomonas fluorescens]MBD8088690.1 thiol:disulfide interchange protein [Pseudomonas fluorescens]
MPRFLLYLMFMLTMSAAQASGLNLNQQPWAEQNTDPQMGLNVAFAQRQGEGISVTFSVMPGFSLYRSSLSFESAGQPVKPISMSKGTVKEDPSFGKVEVYHDGAQVVLPLLSDRTLTVRLQGCLDTGLCFEQQTRTVQIEGELPKASELTPKAPGSLWWFLMAGILLALTPCVLPTLPLLLHAISGGQVSRARQASLGLTYVMASSLCYAALGLAIGFIGTSFDLRTALQGPAPILVITLSLLVLAVVNLGWRVPGLGFISGGVGQGVFSKIQGGQFTTAALLGAVSTIMLSPCVSAPLAGIMLFLAQAGSPVYAGMCLFTLGLGMGLPLLILALGGKRFIPKSGPWLVAMKEGSALLLATAAAVNLSRLLSASHSLILVGILSLGLCAYLKLRWPQRWNSRVGAGLVFALFAYGFVCIAGGFNGQDDWRRPLATKEMLIDRSYSDIAELNQVLRSPGPKALLISADWCLNCKVEERELREAHVKALYPNVKWIKLDITHSTPEISTWLKGNGLFGPPALLFIGKEGREVPSMRQVGNIDVTKTRAALRKING